MRKSACREANRSSSGPTTSREGNRQDHSASNQFICWNCCGLRFESGDPEAVCPNCGHQATRV